MATSMPTAGRIAAAIAFAIVCYLAADAFKPQMPEGTQFGYFDLVCAGIGLLCGWFVSGGLVGRGYYNAIGSGVRTSATAVFFALILFSTYEMLGRALRRLYHGPMDALQGMMAIIAKYVQMLINAPDLVILIGGGAIAGVFAEWAWRRWR